VPELPKIPRFDGLTPVDARKLKELGVLPPELREDIRRMSHQLRQLTPEAEAQRANERLASLRQDLADRKAALEALWREFEAQEAEARREIADLEEQLRKAEAWAAQFGIHPLRQASVTAPTPVEQPEPPAETHVDTPSPIPLPTRSRTPERLLNRVLILQPKKRPPIRQRKLKPARRLRTSRRAT
jgi:hypothetical protein